VAERAAIIIPARYGSTRFMGKPLAAIRGVPMILRVYRRARLVRSAEDVIVATDDRRILTVVEEGGGRAVMTSPRHPTGTSRVAEAASALRHGIIVNVQGDEPMLPWRAVERLIDAMRADRGLVMATLAAPSRDPEELARPDVVKVVCDREGNALCFSRSPLPYGAPPFLRHIGVYAFRRGFLLGYARLPRGPLEGSEGLEQLRALENGFRIRVIRCRAESIGVDRPADIKRIEKRMRSR
jgi:3-deoxy-manno-octulosonate cytidylyltransferase (CMP-KDO synthetase)